MADEALDFEEREFQELSPKQKAILQKNTLAWDHAKHKRPFYLKIAKDAKDLSKKYPKFKHPETRISVVANWIEETDAAVQQLVTVDMDVALVCEYFARTVVGHEDEAKEAK